MGMYVRLCAATEAAEGLQTVLRLPGDRVVLADVSAATHALRPGDGRRLYLFGDVHYVLRADGSIATLRDGFDEVERLFASTGLSEAAQRLEGVYLGLLVDERVGMATVFGDRFMRKESFLAEDGTDAVLATDLARVFEHVDPVHDQLMLAHMFSVYGWYTPKGHTIYANVRQPRVGERLVFGASGVTSESEPFVPAPVEEYGEADLERYRTLLVESVLARANPDGTTWVASSSGWDSSAILAILCDELGSDRVRMLTGSMDYSDAMNRVNKFEIDKIDAIGRFYGIEPVFYDVDFRNPAAPEYWSERLPYYRDRHMYTFISYSLSRMGDKLAEVGGPGSVLLNGETSDSFHMFGFSQFATFFHTSKPFTEYADKMNCYLFSPSFLAKVLDGTFGKDKVYQIFVKMLGLEPDLDGVEGEDLLNRFLFPLFYGSPRVPFAPTHRNPALTAAAQDEILGFPFKTYAPEVLAGLTPETAYSWYCQLYHSFHSQGSTVNSVKHGMERAGMSVRMPFHDARLVEMLSTAPESWGRGLEINNTKHPLKWVARETLRFPYELLETGPHSYLYDVIEGYSPAAEIAYRSGVTPFFKDTLSGKPYRDLLDPAYFDVPHLDRIADDYLEGREAAGADLAILIGLVTLCATGWH